jgi:2-C-methyl-D-erythritol 4-phosphate cytidylyltransferase
LRFPIFTFQIHLLKKFAIIVAAGTGTRMGSAVPKQFLLVAGKTVLWHTLQRFLGAYDDLQIVLVLHEQHIETGKSVVGSLHAANRIILTTGGETRFHSVKNGLSFIEDPSIVFVHDGVRCLVTEGLIHQCFEKALEYGNAVPAIKAVDSLRMETADGHHKILDRDKIYCIQTPQTFTSHIIKTAFAQEYMESFTDEASVVEKSGVVIKLVEGEPNNIKITRPLDLVIAEHLLEKKIE